MTSEVILVVVGMTGLFLEALAITCGAVWAVGRIKAAGAALEVTIQHHSELIGKLDVAVDAIVEKFSDHGERIVRLEEQVKQ